MSVLIDLDGQPILASDGKRLLDTGVPTGSAGDFARRLRGFLPWGWFPAPVDGGPESAPVLAAILAGFSEGLSAVWSLLWQVSSQLRLRVMTGAFLDMAAADYFGPSGLMRRAGEADAVYRARIAASLIAPRNTRAAVVAAVATLTGAEPRIIEPQRAADCHAWGNVASASAGGGFGYGAARLRYGHRGSAQFFVEVSGRSAALTSVAAVVASTKASGVVGWVRVVD